MRRPIPIHAMTCSCGRCRPLAERLAEAPTRARAVIVAGAIGAGILLAHFGPLIVATITN